MINIYKVLLFLYVSSYCLLFMDQILIQAKTGRKPDPQHLESQVNKIQELLAAGKTAVEIQKIMRISRSTFFRYKKSLKNK